jgi:hypothetical protein
MSRGQRDCIFAELHQGGDGANKRSGGVNRLTSEPPRSSWEFSLGLFVNAHVHKQTADQSVNVDSAQDPYYDAERKPKPTSLPPDVRFLPKLPAFKRRLKCLDFSAYLRDSINAE